MADEERVCPLLSMAAVTARNVTDVTVPCLKDECAWWTELIDTNEEFVEDCVLVQIARKLNRLEGKLIDIADWLRMLHKWGMGVGKE